MIRIGLKDGKKCLGYSSMLSYTASACIIVLLFMADHMFRCFSND